MSLESGHYIISSNADGFKVGRYPVEDLSLLPKRIMTLSGRSFGGNIPVTPWIIQQVSEGKYVLKAGGAPVAERDGLLFAHLLDMGKNCTWCIEAVPQCGNDAYIILEEDRATGWVSQTPGEECQIQIRPLIVAPSLPPMYPKNQVFTIVPARE